MRIILIALARTAVLVCLLVIFYAGHRSQPLQLNIRHVSSASLERGAPSHP